MQAGINLLILFCFGFIGLHAQTSLTDIVPAGSTVTKLSSDQFNATKALVWYNDSILLFADDFIPGGGSDIYQYDPNTKQFSKWPDNSTHTTGLTLDKKGNLIATTNNVVMLNKAGQIIKTVAWEYNGERFDNPIDLIADNKGGVYFCDPDFFLTSPPQDKTGVYYIDSIGTVKRVIDDLAEPNGPVLSPDQKKLYVVDTSNKYLYSWDVASDGSVSGKLSLAELQTKTTGGVDAGPVGEAIDNHGNIYVATAVGIQVFSPQGVALTTIVVPEATEDCEFGGKDFKTLYITAFTALDPRISSNTSNIYSIDLNYPGYAVSRNGSGGGTIISALNKPLFEIYPNPAKESLHLRLNSGKVSSIDILTLDGKKVSVIQNKADETNMEFNTQNLKSGMYLLRAVTDGGIVTSKFVIK